MKSRDLKSRDIDPEDESLVFMSIHDDNSGMINDDTNRPINRPQLARKLQR